MDVDYCKRRCLFTTPIMPCQLRNGWPFCGVNRTEADVAGSFAPFEALSECVCRAEVSSGRFGAEQNGQVSSFEVDCTLSDMGPRGPYYAPVCLHIRLRNSPANLDAMNSAPKVCLSAASASFQTPRISCDNCARRRGIAGFPLPGRRR